MIWLLSEFILFNGMTKQNPRDQGKKKSFLAKMKDEPGAN